MVRYNPWKLTDRERRNLLAVFYKSATMIEDYEESKQFFRDLLTVKERAMLARRLQIATMLVTGFTYREISDRLRVAKDTIARVQKWLNSGGDGYRKIIKKLLDYEKNKLKEEIKRRSEGRSIKKRYPQYYWARIID